jgi:putative PIN family toxin of toxin-antitoxin system
VRIVVDTNVLISAALISKSNSRQAFEKIIESHHLLRSDQTLFELVSTIHKPKFLKYFSKRPELPEELIFSYLKASQQILIQHDVSACRDHKDNKYLNLALSGKADLIISGDQDLLVLHPFESIPIITSTEFLNRYP